MSLKAKGIKSLGIACHQGLKHSFSYFKTILRFCEMSKMGHLDTKKQTYKKKKIKNKK